MSAANESVAVLTTPVVRQAPSRRRKLLRIARQQPLGVFGVVVVVMLVVGAVFAPILAPHDPTSIEFSSLQSPGGSHFFGTDDKGRDVLSRVIYGSRTSLQVGIIATLIGTVGGAVIGLVSGYFGGLVDMLIQRVMDALLAFPFIILALIMVAIVGNSIAKLMVVLGVAIVPSVGRVMRGVVLSEKEKLYVEAARSIGVSVPRIMFRHLLPNVAAAIIVIATSLLGTAILVEASLSFLGFGTPPPTPSWGADLSGNARVYFVHAPWMAIFPGLALSLVVLGFNLLGDALRDVLDPRLRNR